MTKYRDPEWVMERTSAMTIACPYCPARIDEECFDPKTGYVLEQQPAHSLRMREAGVL